MKSKVFLYYWLHWVPMFFFFFLGEIIFIPRKVFLYLPIYCELKFLA